MTLKQQILKEYSKLKQVPQSYNEIAKKLDCDKTYVFKVVKEYKNAKADKK
jgi:biotin operon repressor